MLRTIEKQWIRLINNFFFYLPPAVFKWNIISGNFELNIKPISCLFFCVFGFINITLGLQSAFVLFNSIFLHDSKHLQLNIGEITVICVLSSFPLASYVVYVLLYLYPSTVLAINQIEQLNHNLSNSLRINRDVVSGLDMCTTCLAFVSSSAPLMLLPGCLFFAMDPCAIILKYYAPSYLSSYPILTFLIRLISLSGWPDGARTWALFWAVAFSAMNKVMVSLGTLEKLGETLPCWFVVSQCRFVSITYKLAEAFVEAYLGAILTVFFWGMSVTAVILIKKSDQIPVVIVAWTAGGSFILSCAVIAALHTLSTVVDQSIGIVYQARVSSKMVYVRQKCKHNKANAKMMWLEAKALRCLSVRYASFAVVSYSFTAHYMQNIRDRIVDFLILF